MSATLTLYIHHDIHGTFQIISTPRAASKIVKRPTRSQKYRLSRSRLLARPVTPAASDDPPGLETRLVGGIVYKRQDSQ
jgi:hypothetical protein